jgi:hypothetical protein
MRSSMPLYIKGWSVLEVILSLGMSMTLLCVLTSLWSLAMRQEATLARQQQSFLSAQALTGALKQLPVARWNKSGLPLIVHTSFFQQQGLNPENPVQALNPEHLHPFGAQVSPDLNHMVLSMVLNSECAKADFLLKNDQWGILGWTGEVLERGDLISLKGKNRMLVTQVEQSVSALEVKEGVQGISFFGEWTESESPQVCHLVWRAYYLTTQGHLAIEEASGRSEVWFENLRQWEVKTESEGLLLVFSFQGERDSHNIWLT